ncbi:ATP-dependent DNA helicase PIF1 [Coprinopsis cinerea AmutBmut pab1-1]|nr:ATP-dependent DNA helicase PIF1 [Coprinopsis cinerea AmutBmut pab1-1]
MNGEIQRETEFDPETGAILVKKTHPWMTHYTGIVMFLLKCNIDVRFIGSGSGANSFMYYVTDYITKPAMTMHVGLTALSHAIRRATSRIEEIQETHSLSVRDARIQATLPAMISAVNSMMGRQEISQQQIMSYLVGGGDHYTSERFASYNYGETLRFVQRLDEPIEDASPDASAAGLTTQVSLSISEEGITASNKRLDYMYRPTEDPYDTMCLYDFISIVRKEILRAKVNKEPVGREHVIDELQTLVTDPQDEPQASATGPQFELKRFSSEDHPQYTTHGVACRLQGLTPVLLGPNLARRGDGTGESWARDMLILFKPWRSPEDIRERDMTWIDTFELYREKLSPRQKQTIANMGVLSQSREDRSRNPRSRSTREYPTFVDSSDLADILDAETFLSRSATVCVYATASQKEDQGGMVSAQGDPNGRLKDIITVKTFKEFEQCYPNEALMNIDANESTDVSQVSVESLDVAESQIRALSSFKSLEQGESVSSQAYNGAAGAGHVRSKDSQYPPLFKPTAIIQTSDGGK